jgi:nitrilase
MSESRVKVAAVQAAPVFLDLEASLQKALALLEKAATEGARLVVFPEVFLPAWPAWVDEVLPGEDAAWHVRLLEQSVVVPGPVTERLVWGMGDGSDLEVHQTAVGRVGGLICWENFMPLARFAVYAEGIDIWVAPTLAAHEPWVASMRHIAREGACHVIGRPRRPGSPTCPTACPSATGCGAGSSRAATGCWTATRSSSTPRGRARRAAGP